MLLLNAEGFKLLVILLLFVFAYPIYGAIMAFVSGQKVRVRGRGVIGHPDTIPNIISYIDRNTKDIYAKIRMKVSDRRYSSITNATNKLEQLRQLRDLKEDGTITDDEFDMLKQEILGRTEETSTDDDNSVDEAKRAIGLTRKFGQQSNRKS